MTKRDLSSLKVAIVHDWLVGGGAERVVSELHKMFPDAPIYTSYATDEWRKRLDGKVVSGGLQYLGRIRKFIPFLRIWWFTHLNFTGYDLVISSSGNGEAFGIRVPRDTLHVCYCHSPTHFYWRNYNQYLRRPGFGMFDPLARLGLRLLVGPLRRWDLLASKRPDYFIANSTHIQADIKKYYDRESVVIHPPVDTARFAVETKRQKGRSGFVTVGRQVPYKRVDILIEACTKLGLPLTIVGRGPEYARLKRLAGPTVAFDAEASDEAVADYLRTSDAFLFAAFEDFGVTPVEALAAGTPVIAYQAGGALDYVIPGKTGEFFTPQTSVALEKTLRQFHLKKYNSRDIAASAQKFSAENFREQMTKFLQNIL